MLFAIICIDAPEGRDLRAANRPAHLAYLEGAGDRLKLAGPFKDENGNPAGSMLLIEAASETAARLFADNDPYRQAGVFDRVDIRPFSAILGQWAPRDV